MAEWRNGCSATLGLALLGLEASAAWAQSSPEPNDATVERWSDPAEPPAPPREPPVGPARWEIAAWLAGSVYSIDYTSAASSFPSPHGNEWSLALEPRVFLSRVVDDDAPYSLQPFLQRTSTIDGSVGGAGFSTRYDDGTSFDQAAFDVDAGANVYVTRHFALTGGAGWRYSVRDGATVEKSHAFQGSAGLGVRFGDVRLDTGYTLDSRSTDGTFAEQRWGAVGLGVLAVVGRRITLGASGHIRDGGGGGGFGVGFYPLKALGLFLAGSGATFVFYAPETSATDVGGSVGLSYWVTPSLRFSWGYGLTFRHAPEQAGSLEYDQTTHELSLGLTLRPR